MAIERRGKSVEGITYYSGKTGAMPVGAAVGNVIYQFALERFSRGLDQAHNLQPATDGEKAAIRNKLLQHIGNDAGEFKEQIFIKPNGKKRRLIILENSFAKGGESEVQLAATRNKIGELKFWALVQPLTPNIPKNQIERVLSRLPKHKRINVKTYFLDEGKTIRRFADNGDLTKCFYLYESKDVPAIAQSLIDVCVAFWEKGYVHLDLKLENFLVDRDEKFFLSDFGFAEKYTPGLRPLNKGTFRALPFNYQSTDYRHADFHALGVMLLEIYLGEFYTVEAFGGWETIVEHYHPALRARLKELKETPAESESETQLKQLIIQLIEAPETVRLSALKTALDSHFSKKI
ncbi:MAG: protein kinase domain-containing protein [Chlamydiia bacterium]